MPRLLGAVSCLALLLAPTVVHAEDKAAPKLNVLFISIDDLNNNLGCYGHPIVKSPNIDKLAAKGVRFDRAYCQYPLCNPSRTSLLSGMRPDTTKVFDNTTPPRMHIGEAVLLPEHFRKHGYYTARVGKIAHGTFESIVKWDVSENPNRKPPGECDDQAQPQPQPQPGGVKLSWQATDRKDEEEPDGRTARRIVQLIEENKDKPFFIAAGFHKPHLPFVAPKKYFEPYDVSKIALPKEPDDDRKDIPPIALTRTAGDDKLTDKEKQEIIRAYYACTSFTDAQVGLLMDALDRLKLWDNTVVVLWGDHGWQLGEHGGLWRKMTLFEESARVPLIVVAPGKKTGAVSPRFVELVDLYPTLSELCNLPVPKDLEGTSFVPLLGDPQRDWKKAAFTVVRRGKDTLGRSVRTDRYRYTEWGDEKTAELYDHQTDPKEFTNLVSDPKHATALAEMRKVLKEGWRAAEPTK